MNAIAIIFFLLTAGALLLVPRRYAALPLLVGCCYMTMGEGVHIIGLSFPVYRLLLLVGLMRAVLRGEWVQGRLNAIDKLLVLWAAWVFLASFFHEWSPGSGPKYASSVIFNIGLAYYLMRVWCRTVDDVYAIIRMLPLVLAPVAVEMLFEQLTGRNLFAIFDGVSARVPIRNGRLRGQGPFRHSILAGTVGATCLPLILALWRTHRQRALLGAGACGFIVLASASSGPLVSLLLSMMMLALWKYRHLARLGVKLAVALYLVLEVVMSKPPYYLVARIDLAGGSTGWHRARLIESSLEHLSEWWLFGTDYTRGWMPTGVAFSGDQTDITNYYLSFGVTAGLPAALLVVAILGVAFLWVDRIVNRLEADRATKFLTWCLGSGLFAHAVTSLSVVYFDQSMLFFWLNVALISSLYSTFTLASAPRGAGVAGDEAVLQPEEPAVLVAG